MHCVDVHMWVIRFCCDCLFDRIYHVLLCISDECGQFGLWSGSAAHAQEAEADGQVEGQHAQRS